MSTYKDNQFHDVLIIFVILKDNDAMSIPWHPYKWSLCNKGSNLNKRATFSKTSRFFTKTY